MSYINPIKELNDMLSKTQSNYSLFEYIKRVNKLHEEPIELSFMEELLSYVTRKDCCLPHILLVKYGVISGKNTNKISFNVRELLKQYNFIEDKDYLRLEVQAQVPSGTKYKIEYLLQPRTFKLCLMRAKNTELYAKYYLLLEECISYYNEYQIMYKNNLLNQKDDKIDTCLKEINKQSKKIDEQGKQIAELLNYSKDATAELIKTSDNLECTMSNLAVVQDKLEIAVEDRAVKPYDNSKVNQIAVLRSITNSNSYYITCGQKVNVDRAIRLRSKEYILVNTIDKVPNSIYLFDHIKKQLDVR